MNIGDCRNPQGRPLVPRAGGCWAIETRTERPRCPFSHRGDARERGAGRRLTFLQSSQTTQADPRGPSCSPQRMQRFTPSPSTLRRMSSSRVMSRLAGGGQGLSGKARHGRDAGVPLPRGGGCCLWSSCGFQQSFSSSSYGNATRAQDTSQGTCHGVIFPYSFLSRDY